MQYENASRDLDLRSSLSEEVGSNESIKRKARAFRELLSEMATLLFQIK